ncbi:glycosyl hydrolase family 18 protein [Actinokineospora sp. NBRC 105648]|uniref:glycosyl hydrolase family 18 protein n=1 Tax=Actinokineospora sp. NBRC 105648 TaxID=3032206 RepID=UPI00249FE7B9|nr:glycosyl hydrolase family 18 protein [Actinokineospora sp. NBRC 105648]GLZ39044.1 chitinase [Actinokineospora sp. NBRC 105648]
MRRTLRRLSTAAATALLAVTATISLGSPASAAGALRATLTLTGTSGEYTVTNSGSTAVTGWAINFELPAGVTATANANATVSQAGTRVTLTPAYYINTLQPGRSTYPYSPSFRLSAAATPTQCRVDNGNCDGSPDTPPAAPANLRATVKTTKTVTLAWNASTAGSLPVASYEVYRDGALSTTVTDTTASISGLTPNTAYAFTVKAKDTNGLPSAASAPLSVTTNNPSDDTQAPTVPGNLRSTASDAGSVTLAWNASTDNTGVVAYDVFTNGAAATTVTGTTAKVSGLAPSTSYSFTVRARDGFDNASAQSGAVSVTTKDIVDGYARIGYFVQWGIYGRQYFVKNLVTTGAAAKLTHLLYAFQNIDPVNLTCLSGVTKSTTANPQDPNQGDGSGDSEADYSRPFSAAQSVDGVGDTGWETLRGNFNQLKKLKVKYPNLKVLVSLGGWTYSKYFSDVAATDASRKKFVSSCVDTWIKGNIKSYGGAGGPGTAAGLFDGIDIDWEWPGSGDGHAGNHWSVNDKDNLTALLKEFRTQLDDYSKTSGKRYEIQAFTPADPAKVAQGWDVPKIFDYLDVANVQGYDFHGSGSDNSWEPNRTGHQGNLYADADDPYNTKFSAEAAIKAYTDKGANPRKLTLGLAFYGRGWQGVADGGKKGEWQSATGAAPGQFAEEAGTRGYANLLASVPNCTVVHDTAAVATSCYTGNNGQWWTFDDTWSIQQKLPWVKSKRLLGVMAWEMSGDPGTLMTAVDGGLK